MGRIAQQGHELRFARVGKIQVFAIVQTGLGDVRGGSGLDQRPQESEVLGTPHHAVVVVVVLFRRGKIEDPTLLGFRQGSSAPSGEVLTVVRLGPRFRFGSCGDGPVEHGVVLGGDDEEAGRALPRGHPEDGERAAEIVVVVGGGGGWLGPLDHGVELAAEVGSLRRGGLAPVHDGPAEVKGILVLVVLVVFVAPSSVQDGPAPGADPVAGQQDAPLDLPAGFEGHRHDAAFAVLAVARDPRSAQETPLLVGGGRKEEVEEVLLHLGAVDGSPGVVLGELRVPNLPPSHCHQTQIRVVRHEIVDLDPEPVSEDLHGRRGELEAAPGVGADLRPGGPLEDHEGDPVSLEGVRRYQTARTRTRDDDGCGCCCGVCLRDFHDE
mmetsp:Transcript_2371/g.6372  ORF Transcript_2371/g.6372 Transcript_2371/m.6372 type:complete len:380 (+) Transcript_2371:459-1598(+)